MPDRPNLVFLMPDQLRADFLGCYGANFVPTPNVDRLAARGVRFGQAYSLHPVCVPARASLLLGQHALRTGVLDNPGFIRPDYRAAGLSTWPELLNERGYYTAAIGKMHFYPWDARFGFQYRRIAEDKRWLNVRDDYWHTLHEAGHRKYHGDEHEGYFERQGAIVNKLPWELQPDHWVGQEAVRFIRDHGKDGPFAMMVGFPGPHCPYDPAPEFLGGIDPDAMPDPVPNAGHTPRLRERTIAGNKNPWNGVDYSTFSRESKLGIRAHYAALVRQIDHAIGWILEELERQGLADNTVVILSSDHGDALGDHDLIGKAQFYDSAWHVPMIASAPWLEQGAVSDDLVALTDVTATMLRLGGVDVPAFMDARPLPGLGIEGATGRDHLFGALGTGLAIQRDGWRLAKYATGETVLFDLETDPGEQVNRLDDPSAQSVRDRLEGELTAELLALVQAGHVAQRVDVSWQSDDFGREGWQRPYPRPVAR
jgi:arylsulfatase A-like enzyme